MAKAKILTEEMRDIDPTDGNPIMYVTGTYESGDTLPTDHIYQGSWMMNLTDKSVVFFKASNSTWG